MFTVYCMNEKCISKKQVLNIIYYECFYYMCHAFLFIQINIIECFYFINYLAIISKTAQVYKKFHNLFSWATSQIHRLPFTVFKKNCTILQISKIVFSKDNMVINIFIWKWTAHYLEFWTADDKNYEPLYYLSLFMSISHTNK